MMMRKKVSATRIALASIVVCIATFSAIVSRAENKKPGSAAQVKKEDPAITWHFLTVDAVINAYKPIMATAEAEVRPRVLAVVLHVPQMNAEETARFAAEKGLTYFDGAKPVYLYSTRGTSVMLVKPWISVKDNQVVEISLPAAWEFNNLNDRNKVKTDLADLNRTGMYGVQTVRRDCAANNVGKKEFSIYCNGVPAHPVVNRSQLSAGTMYWLTVPAQKIRK